MERFIPAPPAAIFDLLADPARHQKIDGSGAVRGAKGGSQRLALGSRFGMAMKMGVPYAMVSTVVEFEENRRIAWRTRGPTPLGRFAAGCIWRYEIEPVDGGSQVCETWDISRESALPRPLVRKAAAETRRNMAATLGRIDEIVAARRRR